VTIEYHESVGAAASGASRQVNTKTLIAVAQPGQQRRQIGFGMFQVIRSRDHEAYGTVPFGATVGVHTILNLCHAQRDGECFLGMPSSARALLTW
jgi:hypothetical protein